MAPPSGVQLQKTAGNTHQFDADKQQQLIETYNALKAECGQHEPILFIDAMHPTQPTKLSYGWMKRGREHVKVVEATGSHTRLTYREKLNLFFYLIKYVSFFMLIGLIAVKKEPTEIPVHMNNKFIDIGSSIIKYAKITAHTE